MKNGFVVIPRKIVDWEWYSDPVARSLLQHFIYEANFEERKWNGLTIQIGQLVTGRKELSKTLGFSEQKIRTGLAKLKATSEITIQPTNRYSIITLTNYSKYQLQQPAKQPASQPTDNQQITTPKQVNKVNKNTYGDHVFLSMGEHKQLCDDYGKSLVTEYIEKLDDYVGSKGKKYKSHYHTIRSWLRKDGNCKKRTVEEQASEILNQK